MFVIKVQFIDNSFYHTLCIIRIIDGKIAGVAKPRRFCPQHSGEYTMEGADI